MFQTLLINKPGRKTHRYALATAILATASPVVNVFQNY